MKKDNAPAIREQNALSTQVDSNEVEILQSDLIVPYVVIAQGLSDAVKEKKADMGDIVRSTNKQVLGNPEEPIDVIFLTGPKADWVYEQKNKGGKFEYRKREERTALNETLPWQFWADDDGNEMAAGAKGATEWRRVKRLTCFAILPSDIEAAEAEIAKADKGELPDPSKALTPVVISFRSSSYKAGKEIITFYGQARSMRQQIYNYQMKLGSKFTENDQGSFYIWEPDRTKVKGVDPKHKQYVQRWVEILTKRPDMITVDDVGETEATQSTTGPAPRTVNTGAVKDVC